MATRIAFANTSKETRYVNHPLNPGGWAHYFAALLLAFLVASCSKPAPLKTSFRRSALDSAGLVLQVRNTSGKSLSCAMTATNKTEGQERRYSFSLAPSGSTEIGIIEAGWSFKSGEAVRIDVEGHRSLTFKVP